MNILTHPVHTGYQFDLARTGHEFYSLDIPGSGEIFWDVQSRPQAHNYHRLKSLDEAPVKFDLVLAHHPMGYYLLRDLNLPLIFKEHCLRAAFCVPEEWTHGVTYFCFASQTAASRWILPPAFAARKVIIGMGMNLRTYRRHRGPTGGILVVGQHIRARGSEKGYDNLKRLLGKFPITVVGHGSEVIEGGIGPAPDYKALLQHYRTHRVFLNPARSLGMSTLEAMAAGMPVVTFRPVNSDVIRHGINGYVVDTVAEAKTGLKRLLHDRRLARKLGQKARETIRERFAFKMFVKRWDALFRTALYEHHPGVKFKVWEPFDLARKLPEEQRAAELLMRGTFRYQRVGYDQRRMTFLGDGRIGLGARRCERFWDIKLDRRAGLLLEISSGAELTCRLRAEPDGTWKGQWLHHEGMPVVIAPVSSRMAR